jgi:heme/copper-type cytochrome/quinol oxidase subunit 4
MSFRGKDIEDIHKLAESIRVITGFTENHGFDGSLFDVKVTTGKPAPIENKKFDLQLIGFFIAILVTITAVGCNVYFNITTKISMLLLLFGIISAGCAVMAAHLKFKSNGATVIVICFLLAVLVIGFEIYTPREVADKAAEKLASGT